MKKFAAKALFLSLAVFIVFGLATKQVFAATITPSNPQGWASSSSGSASVDYVTGPLVPPAGSGSARLTSGTSGDSVILHNSGFSNNLNAITDLKFSTYKSGTSTQYPKLSLFIDTGNPTFGTERLNFSPESQTQPDLLNNTTAVPNVWQTWDALNGFWSASTSGCSGTIAEYLACLSLFGDTTNVAIVNTFGGLGGVRFQIGSGSLGDELDGNVDNFIINGATYDFEPDFMPIPAPTVTTSAASSVLSASATLNGAANPNGNATDGWFRYATVDPGTCNDSFGISTSVSSLGAGTSDVQHSQAIGGLASGTTYYYCAIAANGGGIGFGTVLNFTTPIPVPTTKSDCMNGGWQQYLIFKNQGECISSLN